MANHLGKYGSRTIWANVPKAPQSESFRKFKTEAQHSIHPGLFLLTMKEKNAAARYPVFSHLFKERKIGLREITHAINHPGPPIVLESMWPEWPHLSHLCPHT